MANWCYNIVEFLGKPNQLNKIGKLMTKMAAKQAKENHGQLPPFVKEEADWLFDIRWEGDILYYETKWSSNITVIQAIADHFKVGFIYNYEESGNGIYGQAEYKNGLLTDIFLEDSDFAQYEYDENEDNYIFEGETHDSDGLILETLLERKIAAHKALNQN